MPLEARVFLLHVRDPFEQQRGAEREQREQGPERARGQARESQIRQQLAEVVWVAGVRKEARGDEFTRTEGEGGVLVGFGCRGRLCVWDVGVSRKREVRKSETSNGDGDGGKKKKGSTAAAAVGTAYTLLFRQDAASYKELLLKVAGEGAAAAAVALGEKEGEKERLLPLLPLPGRGGAKNKNKKPLSPLSLSSLSLHPHQALFLNLSLSLSLSLSLTI